MGDSPHPPPLKDLPTTKPRQSVTHEMALAALTPPTRPAKSTFTRLQSSGVRPIARRTCRHAILVPESGWEAEELAGLGRACQLDLPLDQPLFAEPHGRAVTAGRNLG